MQYAPKLKMAMEEIKAILKKHDIAGFVELHTPGFSEYLNHLDTTYSCASVEKDGVRVKLVTALVGKEKARFLADGTFNMIAHFADILSKHAVMYMDAHDALQAQWKGEDYPGMETGHAQQNN